MTLRVSKTQVSPVALFDDANLVQTMEFGRCCGRHDGDLPQRDTHNGRDEFDRSTHRQSRSCYRSQRTVSVQQTGSSIHNFHWQAAQNVVAVRLTGRAHGIGHQGDALRAGARHRHPNDVRGQVDAVANEFADHSRISEHRRHRTGLSMMDRWHRVEQMGDDVCSCVDCGASRGVVTLGMADSSVHSGCGEGGHRFQAVRTFWRNSHHLESRTASFDETTHGHRIWVTQQLDGVGPLPRFSQERPL